MSLNFGDGLIICLLLFAGYQWWRIRDLKQRNERAERSTSKESRDGR